MRKRPQRESALPLDLGDDEAEGPLPAAAPDGEPVQVVVDVRTPELPQPLTYLAPPDLRPQLRFGSTVLVPLRGREQIGYVVGFGPDVVRSQIRPLAAVLQPESAFEPSLFALVEWVAEQTHASLEEALHCIAPEGQMLAVRATIRLAPAWCAGEEARVTGWGSATRAVAARVRQALSDAGGGLELEALRRRVPEDLLPAVLRRLRRLGWVEEERSVTAPRLRARTALAVSLASLADGVVTHADGSAPAGDDPVASQRLGPKQQAVLDYLRAQPPSAPAALQRQLCEELGVSAECIRSLVARGLLKTHRVPVSRVAATKAAGDGQIVPAALRLARPASLTPEQSGAVSAITGALGRETPATFLLFGVTGSGKTEVYLHACEAVLAAGRRAIYLVPEISLTAQVVEQFRARFGARVGLIHSRLSDGERFDEWQRIRRGEVSVVLGPRSALFTPAREVGLLLVDEEHDSSYKQESAPRYLTRDVARRRAELDGAVLVLGSATPAVETYYHAERGDYKLLSLPERVLGRPLPEVEIIDLREETRARPGLIFGRRLEEAIREALAREEQVILFLNRRGFSTFILCRDCGYVARCPNCNVSLTLHQELGNRLICHHCAYERRAPATCPRCNGTRIRLFGIGTERVEVAAQETFPEARIARLDRDSTARKDSHTRIVKRFREREADLLIGTQMVAKGFDFPDVTLVGVITADTALNLPDFRAAERSFQVLSQVSGRAGRGERPGQVIVQTFAPDHYSIQAAAAHDYLGFYQQEIIHRRELSYPPFAVLARLIIADASEEAARGKIHAAHQLLAEDAAAAGVQTLGPCAAPLTRINRKYRWHLLLKSSKWEPLHSLLRSVLPQIRQRVGAGLTIDVDPQSLL